MIHNQHINYIKKVQSCIYYIRQKNIRFSTNQTVEIYSFFTDRRE